MGNLQNIDAEITKTTGSLFVTSLEEAHITIDMLQAMLKRWDLLGKPLFMAPKDFKERILTASADFDVKLNYLKWLTQALEIDMFEIFSVMIMYA